MSMFICWYIRRMDDEFCRVCSSWELSTGPNWNPTSLPGHSHAGCRAKGASFLDPVSAGTNSHLQGQFIGQFEKRRRSLIDKHRGKIPFASNATPELLVTLQSCWKPDVANSQFPGKPAPANPTPDILDLLASETPASPGRTPRRPPPRPRLGSVRPVATR